jgi:hypothetical protein
VGIPRGRLKNNMEISRDGYLLNKKMWKFQRPGRKPSVEFPRDE